MSNRYALLSRCVSFYSVRVRFINNECKSARPASRIHGHVNLADLAKLMERSEYAFLRHSEVYVMNEQLRVA